VLRWVRGILATVNHTYPIHLSIHDHMERVCLFDPYRLFVLQSLSPDGFCEIDTQTNECLPVAGEEEVPKIARLRFLC